MPLFASRPAHEPAPLDTAPNTPLLSLRNVEKTIDAGGARHHLLRRVTLDVRAGEFAHPRAGAPRLTPCRGSG